jgi:hypothetical protein
VNKTKKRGWFRTSDEDDGKDKESGDSIDMAISAPLPAQPGPRLTDVPVTRGEVGAVDLAAILGAAGVSGEDRDRVDRARNLLQALPTAVSAAVRRQIVETALTTFGVATDRIVDAGQKVNDALQGFIASNRHATDQLQEEARARVQALEQEIFRVRQAAEHAATIHEKRIRDASVEVAAVRQVLDFFGASPAEVDLDETTEDRSDWGVQLPVPPPARLKRDTAASRPPPMPPVEPAGKPAPPDPTKP